MFEDKEEILKREKADPSEGDRPWPLGIWVLVIVMSSFAFAYLLLYSGDGSLGSGDLRTDADPRGSARAERSAPDADVLLDATAQLMAKGEQVYRSICMACHQGTGGGVPGVFPPLDGSSWVTGDAGVPIRIALHGLMGPIEVKGQSYNGVMPGFGGQLSDEDVAAVVSYIRGSWSNAASPVSAEEVASIRAASGVRGPWTGDELKP